jgi:hypothetical protein
MAQSAIPAGKSQVPRRQAVSPEARSRQQSAHLWPETIHRQRCAKRSAYRKRASASSQAHFDGQKYDFAQIEIESADQINAVKNAEAKSFTEAPLACMSAFDAMRISFGGFGPR